MTRLVLLVALLGLGGAPLCQARNKVSIDLIVYPDTHRFSCRYTLVVDPAGATARLALNLSRQLQVTTVGGAGLRDYSNRLFFDTF
jgi:hypothetical protein